MPSKTYIIDGKDFSTLEEFADVFSQVALQDYTWKGNLDAFNDILHGGFGTPDEGFILIWKNSGKSKEDLGYTETEKWYARHLQACQPSNKHTTIHGLEKARKGEAGTVFDWLVEILFEHGPSGAEPEAGVILRLE